MKTSDDKTVSPGRRRVKGKQPPSKGKRQKLEGKGSKGKETHQTKPKSKFDEPKKGGKGKGTGKPKYIDNPDKLSVAVLAFTRISVKFHFLIMAFGRMKYSSTTGSRKMPTHANIS